MNLFENITPTPEDPIIKLIGLYREDPRENKIDVGVGVFKDANGDTPVMEAVRLAEQRLHDSQTTKTYVGLAGDESFNTHIADLMFGNSGGRERVQAVQMPGGCGALRILAEMLHRVGSSRTVWVTDPTWGNHYPLLQGAGFEVKAYPYLDRSTKTVDVDAMMGQLDKLGTDDIVLFHGCCHNPSGAELMPADWDALAELAAKNGFFPFFDIAYQGFGNSLDEDAYSVRKFGETVEAMVVASSCSKNFAIYRDRVGCAMVLAQDEKTSALARGHILSTARSSFSMPPDHGGAIVAMILSDPELRQIWEDELTFMRNRMLSLRQDLAEMLHEKTGSDRWDFIARHRGMFSLLVLSDDEVESLRNDYGVYAVAGGRINIAGLKDREQAEQFADALVAVTS